MGTFNTTRFLLHLHRSFRELRLRSSGYVIFRLNFHRNIKDKVAVSSDYFSLSTIPEFRPWINRVFLRAKSSGSISSNLSNVERNQNGVAPRTLTPEIASETIQLAMVISFSFHRGVLQRWLLLSLTIFLCILMGVRQITFCHFSTISME
jgi:hypothetical protein